MKRPTSLSVPEFLQLLDALCSSAQHDLVRTRARMDALRSEAQPPG